MAALQQAAPELAAIHSALQVGPDAGTSASIRKQLRCERTGSSARSDRHVAQLCNRQSHFCALPHHLLGCWALGKGPHRCLMICTVAKARLRKDFAKRPADQLHHRAGAQRRRRRSCAHGWEWRSDRKGWRASGAAQWRLRRLYHSLQRVRHLYGDDEMLVNGPQKRKSSRLNTAAWTQSAGLHGNEQ